MCEGELDFLSILNNEEKYMKRSTKDQAEGKFHEAKGKVKETAGKLIDDPDLEAEGKAKRSPASFKTRLAKSRRSWGSKHVR